MRIFLWIISIPTLMQLLEKYPEDIAVRTLNDLFLKRYNRLENVSGWTGISFLISKEKNNYLCLGRVVDVIYNQLEDTAAMSWRLECLVFPEWAVTLRDDQFAFTDSERFRASKRIFGTRTCLVPRIILY